MKNVGLTLFSHLCILLTMNYVTINAKTDPALKKQAASLADELGISLSIVINTALRNFVTERKLVVSEDYTPNAFLRSAIASSDRERKNKHSITATTPAEVDALISSL